MHRILVALLALLIAGLPVMPHLAHAYASPGAGDVRLAAADQAASTPTRGAGHHLAAMTIHASARAPACCATTNAATPARGAYHCSFDLVFLVRGHTVSADGGSTIYERHAETMRAFPLHHLLFRPPIAA